MEIKNNLNQRISKTLVFFCFGVSISFISIQFLLSPWTPSFVGSYSSPDLLFRNGMIATAILSLYLMMSISIALIGNFIVNSDKPLSALRIVSWTLCTGIIAIIFEIFSIRILLNLVMIPGGIHLSQSDLGPLYFVITTSLYQVILTFVILVLGKIFDGKKYALMMLIISIVFIFVGVWRININAKNMESQYVLEQCKTLVFDVIVKSKLTSIGDELSILGVKTDKSKIDEIVYNFGSRCKSEPFEIFELVRENLLGLSLSKKTNFESDYQIERRNFIDWINTK